MNEAALMARNNDDAVALPHFEEARDKILMGPERKNDGDVLESKNVYGLSRAGHAFRRCSCQNRILYTKWIIVPRGRAMGVTSFTGARCADS